MPYSVYQEFDPLRVCVVGRSYPPEFYSWMTVPRIRELFEKMAVETEEDFQALITKLQEFGVKILRPDLPDKPFINGKYILPPVSPRDRMGMIGDRFYYNYNFVGNEDNFKVFYNNVRDPSWPDCVTFEQFKKLPQHIQEECLHVHNMHQFYVKPEHYSCYNSIIDHVKNQGNVVTLADKFPIDGSMVHTLGRDRFFGTVDYNDNIETLQNFADCEFPDTRNHVINTGGHIDGTFCMVCPGLIVSLEEINTFDQTHPGWEVIYLPGESHQKVEAFLHLKKFNKGKWWIPGWEYDNDVTALVEEWVGHWTGYVAETVFSVNMLVIDRKNVIVSHYNKPVFDALDRYGITPHIVPFRHGLFWDAGIHCATADLYREGTMQDYFPRESA
jgi:hypothetical protein